MDLQVQDDTINVFYDGGLIYSEKVPVRGGRFATDFVTPRKISIGDTTAVSGSEIWSLAEFRTTPIP